MKYQVLLKLKTRNKQLFISTTLKEAEEYMRSIGAEYKGSSYIGGFPIYETANEKKTFSIQGFVELYNGEKIVCSFDQQ